MTVNEYRLFFQAKTRQRVENVHAVFRILSSSNSSSLGALAHSQRAAGELFIHSSAQLSTVYIPLCVREYSELVREMSNFWLSCALSVSRVPLAMMYYNRLQLTENRSIRYRCMSKSL